MSQRLAPSIAFAAVALAGLPAAASAATDPDPAAPVLPRPACEVIAPPVPGAVKFAISPAKVTQGTQPRLRYVIVNAGRTCLGYTGAPYAIQQSGFAGWSTLPWDTGISPQYIRTIKPGGYLVGTTAPLPAFLSAGGFYRMIPKFTPDASQPVAAARLTVVV